MVRPWFKRFSLLARICSVTLHSTHSSGQNGLPRILTMIKGLLVNGFGLMVLAASLYAITDITLKFLSASFPLTEIAFIRFLTGLIILWPILYSQGISVRGNRTRILILRGIFGTLSFFCLIKSIAMIPLANAIILFYTFPIFVALFSFLLFGEKIKKEVLGLIAVGLLGTYILINPASHSFNRGTVFGLLSSCLGGMAMVLIHRARQTNGPLIIYFYFCLMGGIFSFPFLVQNFKMPNAGQWILLISFGWLVLIGQLLMNQGFKFCKAAEGSLIMMSELVFTGIAGIFIFKDPVTPNFLIGAFLIVGSGAGLNLIHRRSLAQNRIT